MSEYENKKVILLSPQLKLNGDFAGNGYVDCSQWRHLRVDFVVGTTDVAIGSTAEATAPKIEECDTTGGAYTDVAGAALADAIAATEDDSIFTINVDLLKSHKRYMRVNTPTAGAGATGANLTIIATLSSPQIAPSNASEAGLAELINA